MERFTIVKMTILTTFVCNFNEAQGGQKESLTSILVVIDKLGKELKIAKAIMKKNKAVFVITAFYYHQMHTRAKSLQLCPILCGPMDCGLPGSSVHGILQARIMEWVAMLSSRASSQPRDGTHISCVS